MATPLREQRRAGIAVPLHAGQVDAWMSPARHVFVIAGTGGGKTILAPRWMYREVARFAAEDPQTQNYLVFAPSYKVLKRATLPAYLRFFQTLGLGRFKRGDLVYEVRNGANVYFGSCDNPESLEGLHVRAAHGDEIGQDSVSLAVWETVRRRLGFYEGRFLGTTTPYNMGWLKRNVVDPYRAGNAPDTDIVSFSSIANPAYPEDEFRRRRRDMPAWAFRMFHLGEFERPLGLVYDVFDEARHVVEPFRIPQSWPRAAAMDFGLKDPTAALFGAHDPDHDVIYLYAEYKRAARATKEHAADIKRIAAGIVGRWWGDPEDPQLIVDYKGHGLPLIPGNNDLLGGIQEVYSRLATDRLRVFRGMLPHWQDEVERYQWHRAADQEEATKDKPKDGDNHLLDTTRYLCLGLSGRASADLPTSRRVEEGRPLAAGIMGRNF
jgi:Phage terminase large subunit